MKMDRRWTKYGPKMNKIWTERQIDDGHKDKQKMENDGKTEYMDRIQTEDGQNIDRRWTIDGQNLDRRWTHDGWKDKQMMNRNMNRMMDINTMDRK